MTLDRVTSFRIDDSILQKLSHEANQRQISFSKMINIILHDYVDLKSDVSRGGFVGIRRTVLSKLLDGVTNKKMTKIAHHVAEVEGREILLSLRNEIDNIPAFDWLENWFKISGYQYKHDVIDSATHYFLVYHNIGYKWSVYLSHVWGIILKKMLSVQVEFELTERSISFKVYSNRVSNKSHRRT